MSLKCTAEGFAELIEREGIVPAPYMARNMWVQEQSLGETLDRGEIAALVKTAYELVVAKLPKSRRPGAASRAPRPHARGAAGRRPKTRARRR